MGANDRRHKTQGRESGLYSENPGESHKVMIDYMDVNVSSFKEIESASPPPLPVTSGLSP